MVFLPEDKAKIKQCETLVAYHVEAAVCYRRGAESPWLPKAPADRVKKTLVASLTPGVPAAGGILLSLQSSAQENAK